MVCHIRFFREESNSEPGKLIIWNNTYVYLKERAARLSPLELPKGGESVRFC